jgi:ribonuclease P protein component
MARFLKSQRLRRRADFVRVQASSKRVSTPHFLFLFDPTPAHTHDVASARIGFVVSKKVGCAVVRNRVKRVAREAFRLTPGLFPAGIDVVMIARNGSESLGLAEVQAEWSRARGNILRKAEELLRTARSQNPAN